MNKKLLVLLFLGFSLAAHASDAVMEGATAVKKLKIECVCGVKRIVLCAKTISFISPDDKESAIFHGAVPFDLVGKPADVPVVLCAGDKKHYSCHNYTTYMTPLYSPESNKK